MVLCSVTLTQCRKNSSSFEIINCSTSFFFVWIIFIADEKLKVSNPLVKYRMNTMNPLKPYNLE